MVLLVLFIFVIYGVFHRAVDLAAAFQNALDLLLTVMQRFQMETVIVAGVQRIQNRNQTADGIVHRRQEFTVLGSIDAAFQILTAAHIEVSQILQADPPLKYYLSPKACLGILRRAFERGKELPKKLERALKIQAGLMRPDGQPTGFEADHINQRDEGIDLHGVSGALMATTNMQMQTFVTQPDETVEGFDGYNGDLTGDVAATLGGNCGMSTGRNGVMAFAANQRDEVRDLHDVAGALGAQPGMKQQPFVASGIVT